METATSMGCADSDKAEFLERIHSISQLTFKIFTVQSAFKATGLIPHDTERVISKLTEVEPRASPQAEPPSGLDPSIPTTIPTLQSH